MFREKSVDLIWIDSNKSRLDLNEKFKDSEKTIFEKIIETIRQNNHIKLILK
jgi:hypothetical protein